MPKLEQQFALMASSPEQVRRGDVPPATALNMATE